MVHRIKVLMITRDYTSSHGGIPTHIIGLVQKLGAFGVDVEVVEGKSDTRTLLLAFDERLRSSCYDLLHVQSLPYGAFVFRHPLVITAHSPVREEGAYYLLRNKLKLPVAYFLEGMALKKADRIIAVSELTFAQLKERSPACSAKMVIIKSGVDCDQFAPGGKSSWNPPRMLICSRLDFRKNIAEALRAITTIDEEYELTLIGEGPERPSLEKLARKLKHRVSFLGRVSQEELQQKYACSDIFLTTSHQEGFGSSLLQAMASSCAIIASNIPAHRELITHGRDGLIYTSHQELVRYLRQLLSDRQLAARLGKEAREKSLEYCWEKIAGATAALYFELLDDYKKAKAM